MNDVQTLIAAQDTEPTDQKTAGTLLKQAREASGLHIAALAVLLKVPVKKLEALESDRFDLLPDVVFARALASGVCRALKINPANILEGLPQIHAPKLTHQNTGINETFRSPGDGPGPSLWTQILRPAVLAGMVLLLATLVLIFLPVIEAGINEIRPEVSKFKAKNMEIEKAVSFAAAADAPVVQPSASGSSSAPSEPSSLVAAAGINVGAPFAAKISDTVIIPSSLPTSALKVVSVGTSTPMFVVSVSPPLVSDLVVFTAKTESWVEATDAKGQVVLRRILAAGESVGASGALPLKIVVGRANAIQVEIRGKLFDVNAVAKDNVARFEVK